MMVWLVFILVVCVFLGIDLGVFNRRPHVIGWVEAARWTTLWVSVAILFSLVIHKLYAEDLVQNIEQLSPAKATLKYLTGYLIELSLSMDNLFVIAVIFQSFKIPPQYQHKVLFWGILGAIFFRALMILGGVVLIRHFSWMTYVFGLFLIYSAFRMLYAKEESFNVKNSKVFKFLKKFFPLINIVHGPYFILRRGNVVAGTALLMALIMIEIADVVFAVDSIPAILAITTDPFLVFSSNIMAILGLRSMYFFLANLLDRFHYLKYSLVVLLMFVGVKMMIAHYVDIHEGLALGFIALTLGAGIAYSMLKGKVASASN